MATGLVHHDGTHGSRHRGRANTASYDDVHRIALPSLQSPFVQGGPGSQSGFRASVEYHRPSTGEAGQRSAVKSNDEGTEGSPTEVQDVTVDGLGVHS
jgi:hypothetical protein